jgi:tetratricopeptide (TPR) repeat protein
MRLAEAYEATEQNAKAAEQYEKLLKKHQEFAEAHVGLADVYRRFGKHKAAILRLRRACELEPDNAFYWFRLAEACVAAGRRREAIEPATRAAMTDPEDPFYHGWLGELLLSLGEAEDAVVCFTRALELDQQDERLYIKLAAAYCAIEQYERAKDPIERAATLVPSSDLITAMKCDILALCGAETPPMPILDPYDQEELRRWRAAAGI